MTFLQFGDEQINLSRINLLAGTTLLKIIALVFMASLLVGCQSEDEYQHLLQIHDVSGIQQQDLEAQLNDLLQREDLVLKGRVSLIETDQLAVNGPAQLQRQIASILADLKSELVKTETLTNATYRVRYWVLTMAPGEQIDDLPTPLQTVAPALREEFPNHAIQVSDFLESYHFGPSEFARVNSGTGSRVILGDVRPTAEGLELTIDMLANPMVDGQSPPRYQINRLLRNGQPLVLGRSFARGEGNQSLYQLLLAQADLIEKQG